MISGPKCALHDVHKKSREITLASADSIRVGRLMSVLVRKAPKARGGINVNGHNLYGDYVRGLPLFGALTFLPFSFCG